MKRLMLGLVFAGLSAGQVSLQQPTRINPGNVADAPGSTGVYVLVVRDGANKFTWVRLDNASIDFSTNPPTLRPATQQAVKLVTSVNTTTTPQTVLTVPNDADGTRLIKIYRNGLLLVAGAADYTISGTTVQLTKEQYMQTGDVMAIEYFVK